MYVIRVDNHHMTQKRPRQGETLYGEDSLISCTATDRLFLSADLQLLVYVVSGLLIAIAYIQKPRKIDSQSMFENMNQQEAYFDTFMF